MKHMIAMLAASTVLAGCATRPADIPSPPVEEIAPPAVEAPAAPTPEIGTFGFDKAGMDASVAPGDNFYTYANGTWAKTTPIPADKSNYGMFTALDDLSKNRTRAIIDEAAKDPNSKIGQTYNAFLDTDAIEAKGLAPFVRHADAVWKARNVCGWSASTDTELSTQISSRYAFPKNAATEAVP